MQGAVGQTYQYQIMTSDMNRGALLCYNEAVSLDPVNNYRIYSVQISDDVYIENIDRYLADWQSAGAVYLTEGGGVDSLSLEVSRLNLKKYVHSIFCRKEIVSL